MDINLLSSVERAEIGVAGYEAYLDSYSLHPDLRSLLDKETSEAEISLKETVGMIAQARSQLNTRLGSATTSGAFLCAVFQAKLAVEATERRIASVEGRVQRLAEEIQSTAAKVAPPVTAEEIESLRDELGVLQSIHRGASLLWLSESLNEWGVKSARLQRYVNDDLRFAFVSDCPVGRHFENPFRQKTNVMHWSTYNQIAMLSVRLLGEGNYMGLPVLDFLETPETVRRFAAHSDISASAEMRGAIVCLALSTTESLRMIQDVAEHTATSSALELRDVEGSWGAANQALKNWLELEHSGELIQPRGRGVKGWLLRNWPWLVTGGLVAAMALVMVLLRHPAAPGNISNMSNMSKLAQAGNWSIVNNTLVVYG